MKEIWKLFGQILFFASVLLVAYLFFFVDGSEHGQLVVLGLSILTKISVLEDSIKQ